MKVHFLSDRQDWETPQAFFDVLNAEFRFTLDAAATKENAKCEDFISPEQNALDEWSSWCGRTFLNPPYGRGLSAWMEKAYRESRRGSNLVVALIPARTDTKWWHEWVMKAAEVRFVRGRLHFVGAKNGAPFPSAVVIWHPWSEGPPIMKAMDRLTNKQRGMES